MVTSLLMILLFALLAGFYSGVETGAYCLSRVRLRHGVTAGQSQARVLSGIVGDMRGLVCTTLAGHNIAVYLATAFCTALWAGVSDSYAALLSTLTLAPILLVVAEMTPKTLFQSRPNRLMYRVARVVAFSKGFLYPVVMLLKGITVLADRAFGRKAASPRAVLDAQRLHHYFREGVEEGTLSAEQSRMARNIMRLEQIPLGQIMIPVEDVAMIPEDAARDALSELARRGTYSRFPVYREDPRNVVGILVLLDFLCGEDKPRVQECVRPALDLEEPMPIDDAFFRLQRARQPMGIVRDAEGRAVGIVTMKDLVEEIVGELGDW